MNPKPYTTIKKSVNLNRRNLLPKWKLNKIRREKSGKTPGPRQMGISKSDEYLCSSLRDYAPLELELQSGIVTNELDLVDLMRIYQTCLYVRYSMLVLPQFLSETFINAQDHLFDLLNSNKTCDVTKYYIVLIDEMAFDDVAENLDCVTKAVEIFNGDPELCGFVDVDSNITCDDASSEHTLFGDTNDSSTTNRCILQGGVTSRDLGIPINVSVDPNVTDTAKTLFTDLNDSIRNLSDKSINVEHSLNTGIGAWMLEHKEVLGIIILCITGYRAVRYGGHDAIIFTALSSVAIAYTLVNQDLGPWISNFIDIIKSNIFGGDKVTPQGGVDFTNLLPKLAMSGILLCICKNLKSNTALGMVEEFVAKNANIRRMQDGACFTIEFLLGLVQSMLNWFTDLTNLKSIKIKDDPFWEINLFGELVHEKQREYMQDPLKDSIFVAELLQLRAEGEEVRSKIVKMPNNTHQMNALSLLLKELNDLIKDLNTRMVSVNGTRPEPFMFVCTGAPGIGKTTAINCLIPEVTCLTIPEEKLEHFIAHQGEYIQTYNPNDAFYSGYQGQYNLLVDEFGALKDAANGTPTVWSELIRWVNVNPMNLQMADLNSKGRIYFRSQCIWATCNRQHFNSIHSVEEKEAVFRRLNFTWVAAVKREYSTDDTVNLDVWDRKVDWEKVNKNVQVASDFTYLDFHRMSDVKNGVWDKCPIDIFTLKNLCVERIKQSRTEHQSLQSKIDRAVTRALKQRAFKQAGEKCGRCPGCNVGINNAGLTWQRYVEQLWDRMDLGDQIVYDFEEYNSSHIVRRILAGKWTKDDFATIDGHECYLDCETFEELCLFLYLRSESNRLVSVYSTKVSNSWLSTILKYIKKLDKLMAFILPISLIFGCIYGYRKISNYVMSDSSPICQGDYPMRRKNMTRAKAKRIMTQGGGDPNAANIITSLVTRNVWRFTIQLEGDRKYQGCVLCVQNGMVIMPEHFVRAFADYVNGDPENGIPPRPDLEITFTNCYFKNPLTGDRVGRSFTRTLSDLLTARDEFGNRTMTLYEITDCPTDDVGLAIIPGITGKSIAHLFRRRDQRIPLDHKGVLGLVNSDYAAVYHTSSYTFRKNIVYENDDDFGVSKAIQYDIPTRVGDCGAPFVIFDKSSECKIASIHVAGIGGTVGIGIIVDQEGIKNAIEMASNFEGILQDLGTETLHPDIKPLVSEQVVVVQGGPVYEQKAKPIPQARKTKIIPSPIHNLIDDKPPCKAPALLTRRGNVDPMANAMFGYGINNIRPRLDLLRVAVDDYCKELYRRGSPASMRRVLTFEEAVMGIPGEDFMDGINRSTSPGWPMKHLLTGGSKKSAFGEEEWEFTSKDCAMVKQHMEHIERVILERKRPYVVNNHFLKDELRPLDRVAKGKTRLISSADLTFSLLLRKYTLMFSSFVMRGRINNGVAVGINVYSDEWYQLASHLGENHPKIRLIAGDFSGYDKSLAPDDIWVMKTVMLRFYQDYGEDSQLIRDALIDEIAQSRHLVGDLVYSWMGGNTSGNTLTVVINSITGCVLDRYVILLGTERIKKIRFDVSSAEIFLKNMRGVVVIIRYGDDGLMSVSIQSVEYGHITQQFMTESYASIGMVYTDENKSTDCSGERTLSQVTFLKRGFARTYHLKKGWMAPLSLDTILESIQWTKEHDLDLQFWKDNIDHMLIELSAHPKEIFNNWSRKILAACAKSDSGYVVVCPSYRDLQDKFVSLEYVV